MNRRMIAVGCAASIVVIATVAYFIRKGFPTVCSHQPRELARLQGEYVSESFLKVLTTTRSIPNALEAEPNDDALGGPAVALSVDPGQIFMSIGWHAAQEIPCIIVRDQKLGIEGSATSFVKVSNKTARADNASAYFQALFKGCFRDELEKTWCFAPNAIEIDGTRHPAELELDPSEHEFENSVHVDGDREHFWFFRPTADGGWHVFQGGWLTDGLPPVDWEHPWRVLKPVPTSAAQSPPSR